MIVKAQEYIKSGFSAKDADSISPAISNALENSDVVEIDFTGVSIYTTLFFSQSLTYLIGKLGKKVYETRIKVTHLSESGKGTYDHALEYAIDYYSKTPEEQDLHNELIKEALKDL